MFLSELRGDARWLASGFMLMLSSGFGQTYFIAIFAGVLKADLGMSDGAFGSIYTGGTLASAALLMWAGKFADEVPIRWLGAGVITGLALTALAMSGVGSMWLLLPIIFGLRFFGQGMLTHVAMTAMARWFNRKRGRAISIAALGIPAGDAVLPIIAVSVMAAIGWRMTWAAAAMVLLFAALPLFLLLLKREREPASAEPPEPDAPAQTPRHEWTRGEVLRSPLFYALLPGFLSSPFILTAIFFNQVELSTIKGWELAWIAASFPVMSLSNVLTTLVTGYLVDRFGARRLLPVYLVPMGLGAFALAFLQEAWVWPLFMASAGITMGLTSTVHGAVWAELYGTLHLGAVRALGTAAAVFATALSPGLSGVLLDAGIGFEAQLFAMAAYCGAAFLWMCLLIRPLDRQAAA
ncbi:MFS transporter [Tepidicaulis sp. LMO-SS28]|uniref:MFS transporter n=1 Tax=Tepidicaulis sp. LMO-SS28 TaxID=3447455 RepID=UPI003EE241C5